MRAAYLRCRSLNARHGRTYFLATRLLPPARRPAVHALYGFARHADDIVDDIPAASGAERARAEASARLGELDRVLRTGLRTGHSDHPLLAAVVDTATRYHIDERLFSGFLRSMRMDLTTTDYATRAELSAYIHGSAEVIGLQMLPVLGTVAPAEEAAPHAAALGAAFQLTNFLRDVAEDLDRGRVYLPADELAAHGVDRDLLLWCRRVGYADPRVRDALADQVARTRRIYRQAHPGIAMLHPAARPCVATAYILYSRILDVIAERGFDVFSGRAVVGGPQRAALACRTLARTVAGRVLAPRVEAAAPRRWRAGAWGWRG
nr:phytoene/squalene synthase family protein [Saccharomonospora saliphila]